MILAIYTEQMRMSAFMDNNLTIMDEWLNLQTGKVIFQQREPRASDLCLLCGDRNEERFSEI